MRCRTRATDATRGWIPSTDRRHALHRADEGLRALHAAAPVMAMWDDHDITNNAWTDGGENHQPETDGDYVARRRAGIRAFHEWLPTREPRASGSPTPFGEIIAAAARSTAGASQAVVLRRRASSAFWRF